jgi:Ni/Co efflux regulator RcnB
MKKTLTIAAAASVLALSAAGAASAQSWDSPRPDARYERGDWRDSRGGWMNINQRQAKLDHRIDQGVRNGTITRREAYRLRSEFQTIARLEYRYRANGLSNWERADLDRRFDGLASRIRWERRDGDRYGAGYGHR